MDKYAIIGNPVEHSLSPIIFNFFGKQTGITFHYIKIKSPLNGFDKILKQFQQEGGKGANITLPFKRQAYKLSNKQSDAAKKAQAASALQFFDNGTIYAVNYDGFGLVQDLTHNHNIALAKKTILILGAGGATQGILGPLTNTMPAKISIVNRTVSKAYTLASDFYLRGVLQGTSYDNLKPVPYDIVIHATSLGHQGKLPPLPTAIIGPETCCYDLSYGKIALPFLQWAKKHGANKCLDGLGMLIEHNAALFYSWFGVYPNTTPILNELSIPCKISLNKL